MIIRNGKYLISEQYAVFEIERNKNSNWWKTETQFVFILVYRLFDKNSKETDPAHNVTVESKNCLLCCITYTWDHENMEKKCRKKWKKKPGWFHLHQGKWKRRSRKNRYLIRRIFGIWPTNVTMRKQQWETKETKIKILYYARWQRWRSIKRLNCHCVAVIWSDLSIAYFAA